MPREARPTSAKTVTKPLALEADWVRVGETLRTLRELRGFKIDEFASAIGISRPYLANIEAGRKRLTNVLLAKAARQLEIEQIAIMRPHPEPVPA